MSNDIISAALTFTLLAGGTAAIGAEMFAPTRHEVAAATMTLPTVVVTGKRVAPTLVAINTVAPATRIR